jgi:hypothetical protein
MTTRKGSKVRLYLLVGGTAVLAFVLVFGIAYAAGYLSPEQSASSVATSTSQPPTSQVPLTTTAVPSTPPPVESAAPVPGDSQPTATFDPSGDRMLDAYGLHFTMKADSSPSWVQVVDTHGLTDNRVILIKGGCQFEIKAQCLGLVVAPEESDPFKEGECGWNGVYDNLYYGSPSAPVSQVMGTVPAEYIKLTQCRLDGSIVENPDILHLWRFANGTVVYDQDPGSDDITAGTDQIFPLLTLSR